MTTKERRRQAVDLLQWAIGREYDRLLVLYRNNRLRLMKDLLRPEVWAMFTPEEVWDPNGIWADITPEQMSRGELPCISRERMREMILNTLDPPEGQLPPE